MEIRSKVAAAICSFSASSFITTLEELRFLMAFSSSRMLPFDVESTSRILSSPSSRFLTVSLSWPEICARSSSTSGRSLAYIDVNDH